MNMMVMEKNEEEKFGVIMCRFKMKAMIGKGNNDGDELCQRLEVSRVARGWCWWWWQRLRVKSLVLFIFALWNGVETLEGGNKMFRFQTSLKRIWSWTIQQTTKLSPPHRKVSCIYFSIWFSFVWFIMNFPGRGQTKSNLKSLMLVFLEPCEKWKGWLLHATWPSYLVSIIDTTFHWYLQSSLSYFF